MLVLAAVPGFASPILVSNFSFETLPGGGLPFGACGAGCAYSAGVAIPGWSTTGVGGQFQPGNPGNTTYFNSLSDGPTSAWASSGVISQVVGTVLASEKYTLLVDIGWRKDLPFSGTVDLLINGHTYIATGALPTRGTFGTFTATYTSLTADVGQPINIQLISSGAQGNFDNVRLDAVSTVPDPASFTLFSGGLVGLLGLLLRRSRSRGTAAVTCR